MTMNGGTSLRVEAVVSRLSAEGVEAGPLVTVGLRSMIVWHCLGHFSCYFNISTRHTGVATREHAVVFGTDLPSYRRIFGLVVQARSVGNAHAASAAPAALRGCALGARVLYVG
jgi:hypothetical protein